MFPLFKVGRQNLKFREPRLYNCHRFGCYFRKIKITRRTLLNVCQNTREILKMVQGIQINEGLRYKAIYQATNKLGLVRKRGEGGGVMSPVKD